MTKAEFLVNAYIDANILLAFAALVIVLGRGLMAGIGFGAAFRAQLTVVGGILLTLVLIPVISSGSDLLSRVALPSASDIMVARFLNGDIAMSATDFDSFLGLRTRFVEAVAAPRDAATMVMLSVAALAFMAVIWRVAASIARLRATLNAAYTIRRHGRVAILSSDSITVPFTARGPWTYYVVIPTGMFDDSFETKIAIGHELQHIRQHDVEWEIALELLAPLFFWNPAYWLIRRQLRTLREYACDQEFLARSGLDRHAYGKCLIDVAQRAMARRHLVPSGAFSVPLIDAPASRWTAGSCKLGRRIHALVRMASCRPSRVCIVCLTLPLSLSLVVMAQSISRPNLWSHDRIMLTTVINLERIHSLNAALGSFSVPQTPDN
ncbi:MAG: M56 family metallopeptidase [Rhodobacteraceae bacterium]|nr:M56 family metallopeptidase [Paracoccaceae bacterium]MCP5341087.1 M56 family metallopeptidase [Paracoccaceae bacterium]